MYDKFQWISVVLKQSSLEESNHWFTWYEERLAATGYLYQVTVKHNLSNL